MQAIIASTMHTVQHAFSTICLASYEKRVNHWPHRTYSIQDVFPQYSSSKTAISVCISHSEKRNNHGSQTTMRGLIYIWYCTYRINLLILMGNFTEGDRCQIVRYFNHERIVSYYYQTLRAVGWTRPCVVWRLSPSFTSQFHTLTIYQTNIHFVLTENKG